MTRNSRFLLWIAAGAIAAGMGFVIMQLVAYVVPMDTDTAGSHVLFTLVLIALGLGAPFLMVKAGFHAIHTRDPSEPEMRLGDIPKDKDDLDHAA
jgi:hypothetical protein